MYVIGNKKIKGQLIELDAFSNFVGFMMGSKNKVFMIAGQNIKNICVINKKLAHPLASKKVSKQYTKLIRFLTELIIDDDDSGESFREALNQIERFRLMIKNKYRNFLTQTELEIMSKQLVVLQKEATNRLMEIQNSFTMGKESNRSR